MTASQIPPIAQSTGPEFETIHEVLKDFGLSDSENAIFSTLLRIGARQASTLAKRTGISRAHVYDILDRLVRRGLVSMHEKDGVRHFTAMSLDELILALEQKEAKLAERREQLREITLSLDQPALNMWADPLTKSYRGSDARARIFHEIGRKDTNGVIVFCCAKSSLLFEELAPTADSLTQLIKLANAPFKVVLYSDDNSATELAQASSNPEIVAFSDQLPAEMIVSGNKVTFIGKRGSTMCCITLEQPALAASLRIIGISLIGSENGSSAH